MSGTMMWVGFDVHARSMHGAAIDSMTGELTRLRFGPGIEGPVAWLSELPGAVKACYEAGPASRARYVTRRPDPAQCPRRIGSTCRGRGFHGCRRRRGAGCWCHATAHRRQP